MAYGRERKGDHSPAPRPKCPTAAITASNDTRNMRENGVRSLSVTCEPCHHEALMNVDVGRPIGRCDLLRDFNHGLWRNLAVRRLGRRRLGPSPGHIEEGFSFCLVFAARAQRRQSSANCRYSSAVAMQRSHRYRPCAYREHKVATTSHARNLRPAPD